MSVYPSQRSQARGVLLFVVLPTLAIMALFYLLVIGPAWTIWDAERATCEAQTGRVWVQSRSGASACVVGERMP